MAAYAKEDPMDEAISALEEVCDNKAKRRME
jgi:hypothetical protein